MSFPQRPAVAAKPRPSPTTRRAKRPRCCYSGRGPLRHHNETRLRRCNVRLLCARSADRAEPHPLVIYDETTTIADFRTVADGIINLHVANAETRLLLVS